MMDCLALHQKIDYRDGLLGMLRSSALLARLPGLAVANWGGRGGYLTSLLGLDNGVQNLTEQAW